MATETGFTLVAKMDRYYNPNLELDMVNEYSKFDQIPLIHSQDIERKQNFDNQGPQLCCTVGKLDV